MAQNIATHEIGIPVRFASKLTYPEPVTAHNVAKLRQLVRRRLLVVCLPALAVLVCLPARVAG